MGLRWLGYHVWIVGIDRGVKDTCPHFLRHLMRLEVLMTLTRRRLADSLIKVVI